MEVVGAYFVQALIISTLYKAVHLTAVWGGYYCCFRFTDDEAEAQEQGVCGAGPGNHPTQCSDSGSWARVFNHIFTWLPASLKRCCNVMKTFAQGYETSKSEWDYLLWLKLKFHFLHLGWLWVWTVASMLRMVLGKPLLPRWSRAMSAPQRRLHTPNQGCAHGNCAVNLQPRRLRSLNAI